MSSVSDYLKICEKEIFQSKRYIHLINYKIEFSERNIKTYPPPFYDVKENNRGLIINATFIITVSGVSRLTTILYRAFPNNFNTVDINKIGNEILRAVQPIFYRSPTSWNIMYRNLSSIPLEPLDWDR